MTETTIRPSWIPVINSGFDYLTEIEDCYRDIDYMRSKKFAMYPSSNHINHTYFYENYLLDIFWKYCNYTEVGMVR